MSNNSYNHFPTTTITGFSGQCWRGWPAVCTELNQVISALSSRQSQVIIAIETYTGLHDQEVAGKLQAGLQHQAFLYTQSAFKSSEQIDALIAPFLGGNDPIFGFYTHLTLEAFFDPDKQLAFRNEILAKKGVVVVYGAGALLCCTPDLIVYADMPRWEGQLRQRRNEVSNLGVENANLRASLQYKRAFFIDWRVCDRLKKTTLSTWDYLLDTTIPNDPKLITGDALRGALDQIVTQPFRVVPFFDPAPWGGQWMKEKFGLDAKAANYGWGFDCVPEENSLLLQFDEVRVEIPAQNLVYYRPRQLLGDYVYGLFGPEFPIRFDFLDTVGGGNLSLQVHPIVEYAQEKFGLHYTQEESYYMLAAGEKATVYLGLKTGIDPDKMCAALQQAQEGGPPFAAEEYINKWPAKKHDHFLIPAGTVHCSGADGVVLEISATPYIFTFKLWDWERLGLDGLPRPINIGHGRKVIQWERQTDWVKANLINALCPIAHGAGWREERTGLHSLQFIETRRHWFTQTVPHDTRNTVNVLNLVEGAAAIVESPTQAFAPFQVNYAETFIIPAQVGAYSIRPLSPTQEEYATIKAFVRADNA
ncbi:MAG TPA: class I mannose-6-phosphate isomerase [Gammaproteobacteria bacterium]|nr:class I mannose-6-phosphate isomerase [Gammaproteobacteria bacterium]